MKNIKVYLSISAFVAAILLGFIAMFIPPTGIIDASVLWFTSQLLVFVATMLGVNLSIDGFKHKVSNEKNK